MNGVERQPKGILSVFEGDANEWYNYCGWWIGNIGIVGEDGVKPAIDGGNTPGCVSMTCPGHRVFRLDTSDDELRLTNITIQNGNAGNGGGFSIAAGSAILTSCTVSSNVVSRNSGGGYGFFITGGSVILTSCTVSSNVANQAHGYTGGGGFYIQVDLSY